MKVEVDVRRDQDAVTIEGVFLDAKIITKKFDGVERHEGVISVMTSDSPSQKNTMDIIFKDISMLSLIKDSYQFGSRFVGKCLANAYQNTITYRLYEVLPA